MEWVSASARTPKTDIDVFIRYELRFDISVHIVGVFGEFNGWKYFNGCDGNGNDYQFHESDFDLIEWLDEAE